MPKLSLLLAATALHAESIPLPGLSAPAEIAIDSKGVPHVFAATDLDAARTKASCMRVTASSRWTQRAAR